MNTPSVKYDQIAPGYDRRYDPQQTQPILGTLVDPANQVQAQAILEVGCGTLQPLRRLVQRWSFTL